MDPSGAPSNMLDSRAKTVWRVYASAVGIPALIAIVVTAGILIAVGSWAMVWLVPVIGALVLLGLWLGPFVEIAYRRWRWEVTDIEVRLQSGLIIVKRTVIPMARIQHVDTSQGPLLRFFGMSEVHVSTAAGKHKIPMLADEDAAGIRDRIAALAQVTDDGGL